MFGGGLVVVGGVGRGRAGSGLRVFLGLGCLNREQLTLTSLGMSGRQVTEKRHEGSLRTNVTPPSVSPSSQPVNAALVPVLCLPHPPSIKLVWKSGPVTLYLSSSSPSEPEPGREPQILAGNWSLRESQVLRCPQPAGGRRALPRSWSWSWSWGSDGKQTKRKQDLPGLGAPSDPTGSQGV